MNIWRALKAHRERRFANWLRRNRVILPKPDPRCCRPSAEAVPNPKGD